MLGNNDRLYLSSPSMAVFGADFFKDHFAFHIENSLLKTLGKFCQSL